MKFFLFFLFYFLKDLYVCEVMTVFLALRSSGFLMTRNNIFPVKIWLKYKIVLILLVYREILDDSATAFTTKMTKLNFQL